MTEQIIWQPSIQFTPDNRAKYDFKITLDAKFAQLMYANPISTETAQRMQTLGLERIKSRKYNCSEPFSFLDNTCLVDEIHLGKNGLWLSMERQFRDDLARKSLNRNPVYYSHNTDTSTDACTLLELFGLWIDYAEIIRKSPNP